jgi:hypothetical protein
MVKALCLRFAYALQIYLLLETKQKDISVFRGRVQENPYPEFA